MLRFNSRLRVRSFGTKMVRAGRVMRFDILQMGEARLQVMVFALQKQTLKKTRVKILLMISS